jgi:putative ABC transport system substrate-binding protein
MRRRELIGLMAGATVWPLAARAQRTAMSVIGYLHFAQPGYIPTSAPFLQGLKETGFVEGSNVTIEYRWAEGQYDRSATMAADLVGRKVDLIAAFGPALALAAKDATSAIPIVFEVGNDAVEAGLVTSLARPGGNATGMSILFTHLTPKLLELISELVPQAKSIALLVNPNGPITKSMIQETEEAAQAKGLQLPVLKAATDGEIDAAFAALTDLRADAVIVSTDPFFGTRSLQIVARAARAKIPAVYFSTGATALGGLISYGTNLPAIYRQMGIYAGRILKGEKPADLPVEQPTKFEMVINLKTAKTLGLTVPPTLLAIADEVIE